MLKNGVSTDKAKYNTSIEKNGFILTILNLTVEYLNVSYDCSCGVYNYKDILYIDVYTDLITDPNTEEQSTISTSEKEDLSTVDNLNKTTNGTNDGIWVILAIILTIGPALIIVIVVIVIKRRWLWERWKGKDNGTQRKKKAKSEPYTERYYSAKFEPYTERYYSAKSEPSTERYYSDEIDGPNVTHPLLQTTPVDSNPGQSSDSSLPTVLVDPSNTKLPKL